MRAFDRAAFGTKLLVRQEIISADAPVPDHMKLKAVTYIQVGGDGDMPPITEECYGPISREQLAIVLRRLADRITGGMLQSPQSDPKS